MGRVVAIKLSGERFSDRFERGVRAVAALNHPTSARSTTSELDRATDEEMTHVNFPGYRLHVTRTDTALFAESGVTPKPLIERDFLVIARIKNEKRPYRHQLPSFGNREVGQVDGESPCRTLARQSQGGFCVARQICEREELPSPKMP